MRCLFILAILTLKHRIVTNLAVFDYSFILRVQVQGPDAQRAVLEFCGRDLSIAKGVFAMLFMAILQQFTFRLNGSAFVGNG